jgi:hypothetical protein
VKPTYLVLETPKAVATMVLVTVAFLYLGNVWERGYGGVPKKFEIFFFC